MLARARRLPFRLRVSAVTRSEACSFARLAGYVSVTEAAATVIYAVHRLFLGVFGSAATVGLYEGPVRAYNVLRALNAATTVTVLPVASAWSPRATAPAWPPCSRAECATRSPSRCRSP